MSDKNDNDKPESKTMREHFEKRVAESMSREEYVSKIKPYIISGEPFRLEVIYDSEKKTLIIQGDENGLKHFAESTLGLAHPDEKAGHHVHWDKSTTTLINIKEMTIQKVNSYDKEDAVDDD